MSTRVAMSLMILKKFAAGAGEKIASLGRRRFFSALPVAYGAYAAKYSFTRRWVRTTRLAGRRARLRTGTSAPTWPTGWRAGRSPTTSACSSSATRRPRPSRAVLRNYYSRALFRPASGQRTKRRSPQRHLLSVLLSFSYPPTRLRTSSRQALTKLISVRSDEVSKLDLCDIQIQVESMLPWLEALDFSPKNS